MILERPRVQQSCTPYEWLSEIVRAIKANSSKFIHEKFPSHLFQWQSGYAAFTVSHAQADSVINYIGGQAEHHRRISFEEEFAAFIKNTVSK